MSSDGFWGRHGKIEVRTTGSLEPNRGQCAPHGWHTAYSLDTPCPACLVDTEKRFWRERKMNGRPSWVNKALEVHEKLMKLEQEQNAGCAGAHQSPPEEPTAPGGVSGRPWPEDPSEGVRLPSGIDLGTVVSLRGGGPSMTVVGVPVPAFPSDPQLVECAWEEHGGLLFREFPVKALMFRKEEP